MTVAEAVRQIRREAGAVGKARQALERVQAAIAAPLPEEVAAMAEGSRPVSAEAHLIGILQAAIVELENVEEDLRYLVGKDALRRLEEDWKRGSRPNRREIRCLQAALEARRA